MSQLEITSCGEQIDISVFEDLSITIPDEFNDQSITVSVCEDDLVVSFFVSPFSPPSLFAAGEQGVWYDPSDFSTMFQDSAGTTPVTAVEQPVGRILDKSGRSNHATQATSASRPVLSARVNRLTYSEQFENAAWTKTNTTVTANATTDPNGNVTADQLSTTAATTIFLIGQNVTVGAAATALIYTKANTTGFLQLTFNGDTTSYFNFNLTSGVVGSSAGTVTGTIRSVGNGWYECIVNNSATTVTGITWGIVGSATATRRQTFTATGAESIYIWGADLRPTNQTTLLPVYQRIAAATDYDTTGFPYYLRFDGTDDSLATATFTPGTDKVQVFAGVRKLSDAARAIAAEFNTGAASAGNWGLNAPNTAAANYAMRSIGTIAASAESAASFASPITNVVTGLSDISGDAVTLRVNATQVAQTTSDQGTGNFLAFPLYLGSRAGTSFRLNGNIYSLIVRFGANLDATTISNTETWVNGKTRAY
tara:strand:+ start:16553 stop:17995 length:1443 start_codon:yes stop_codon:yes gene_type:complete